MKNHNELIFIIQHKWIFKFLGKVYKWISGNNPIQELCNQVTETESGTIHQIDEIKYYKNITIIRGWCFNKNEKPINLCVFNKKYKILKTRIINQERADVEAVYNLKPHTVFGFEILLNKNEIKTDMIYIHYTSLNHYVLEEVSLLGSKNSKSERNKAYSIYKKSHREDFISIENDGWTRKLNLNEKELKKQRKKKFQYNPLISIIVPLYNTPIEFLQIMVNSILNQTYSNVQLCLADGSDNDIIENYIKVKYKQEKKIIYKRLLNNDGISGNTNEAFKLATGEYIMLCDHDDEVTLNACYEMVKALNKDSDIDIVYTDEDKMDMDGEFFFEPNYKSDFNLEFLRCNNYICHIFFVRKSIVEQLKGPFDSSYDGAQDYDFILKCCEKAKKIAHIPKILYHWRCHPLSTAGNIESKGYAKEAGRNAVADSYKRCGIEATVESTEHFGRYRSYIKLHENPLVSIIIGCFRCEDDVKKLLGCLSAIKENTDYSNYEIILLGNQLSFNQEVEENLQKEYANVIIHTVHDVNTSDAIGYNQGANIAKGRYLVFMHPDILVRSKTWMKEMISYCQLDEVGVVGGKILYSNHTIYQAGLVIGMYGEVGCEFEGMDEKVFAYTGRANTTRYVSAVSALLLMTKKEYFNEMNGFSKDFGNRFFDIDYCLRLKVKGKYTVYNAYVEMYYNVNKELVDNRDKNESENKLKQQFIKTWEYYYKNGDPFFNPNYDSMIL